MAPLADNPLNPPLAVGVRRFGFRKWYERELLSSHAHMVLAVLAVIALLGGFELMRGAAPGEKLLNLGIVLASGLVGFWALRRYLFLLMRAEELANQASCPACGDYGRFTVVRAPRGGCAADVRCSKCAQEWTISAELQPGAGEAPREPRR